MHLAERRRHRHGSGEPIEVAGAHELEAVATAPAIVVEVGRIVSERLLAAKCEQLMGVDQPAARRKRRAAPEAPPLRVEHRIHRADVMRAVLGRSAVGC